MLFQQLSGINAVLFYAQEIFERALTGSVQLQPALCAIIIGLVQVVASTSTVALTAFVSMRTLFAVSAVGAAVAHVSVQPSTGASKFDLFSNSRNSYGTWLTPDGTSTTCRVRGRLFQVENVTS